MKSDGFDWDLGNWPKCAKHGLTKTTIEQAFHAGLDVFDDPIDPRIEKRFRAIGKDASGRHLFVVFCLRRKNGKVLIRPISARYMREKEVRHYARQRKNA